MDIREQVREEVNSYKTKHKQGFIREEYMKLLENYPSINMDRFWDALNGITAMRIDGETVVFHHDIELAIRNVYGKTQTISVGHGNSLTYPI